MKKIIIIAVIALSLTSIFFILKTPSVINTDFPFEKFDKSRIDVGTMYVYEFSKNKVDFEPSFKECFYIKSLNDIEMFYFDIKDTIAAYFENYSMNWNYMMLANSEIKSLKDKNDVVLGKTFKAKSSVNFVKKEIKYNVINKTKDGFKSFNYVNKFNSIPTYFYASTSLIPLWFALRFYPLGKEKITVNSFNNNYNTDFDIKYEGKEKVDVPYGKILCYKFELVPHLSFFMRLFHSPKKAFIWLTSEDTTRYMVKYRNNNEQNAFTQSMEYRLAERKKMTPEEWEKFKKEHGANDKD